MLFNKCSEPGCTRLASFRNLRLCTVHYQMLIADGAVETESEEQARQLMESREKPNLTTGNKQEESKEAANEPASKATIIVQKPFTVKR
jgi:hypothetical protein